jgi:hypothetical protein
MAWFKKSPPPSTQPPVSIQFDQCCYTLILNHIEEEHTNAEALWQKKFTAYPTIAEKNTANENYRLQTALDKNTAHIHCYNEKLKRTRPEAFVYSDVVVWLPQIVVDRELRQNTGALDSLTTNLPVLHQDRFKPQLLKKRTPHYVIMASDVLLPDEVAFQFGFGIYIAESHEVAQMQVEAVYLDENDKEYPFTPQVSYQIGKMSADNAIYPEQDNVLIIKPSEHLCSTLPYSVWFSDVCSHIQLQRNKDQWKAFANSGADNIKIDTQLNGREWQFEFTDSTVMSVNGKVPRLRLTLKPLHQIQIEPEPAKNSMTASPLEDWQSSPINQTQPQPVGQNINHNQAWGSTVIPDIHRGQSYKTIIPGSQTDPMLILEGLALPRIDNAQGRVNGLKQWTIWFDNFGNIVDGNNSIDRSQLAAVSGNQQQATAVCRRAGQGSFIPLTSESEFYLANQRAFILPSPLPERFHAVVKLINPINFVLQEGVNYTVGRKGDDALPEIDLTLLNDPQGMAWEAGSPYAGSVLSMLSLSRNHLSFSLQNGQLQLSVPSNKQPVYILDSHLDLKETLQNAQRSSELLLLPNEYLLLGSFVLRFVV